MEDSYMSMQAIAIISAFFSFIPFITSLIRKDIYRSIFYPIGILSIIVVLTEILNGIHGLLKINNYYLFHIYTLVEFGLISLFFINFFKKYFRPIIFYFCLFLFPLIAFIDYRINGLEYVDTLSSSVECILILLYSLYLFYFLLRNLIIDNLLTSPVFWFNSAILFYFAGNLFLFASTSILNNLNPNKNALFWTIIHSFLNICYNILITVGIWKTRVK